MALRAGAVGQQSSPRSQHPPPQVAPPPRVPPLRELALDALLGSLQRRGGGAAAAQWAQLGAVQDAVREMRDTPSKRLLVILCDFRATASAAVAAAARLAADDAQDVCLQRACSAARHWARGETRALRDLVALTGEPCDATPRVRRVCLELAGEVVAHAAAVVGLAEFCAPLAEHTDVNVRCMAAWLLAARPGEAPELLARLASDSCLEVRVTALVALAQGDAADEAGPWVRATMARAGLHGRAERRGCMPQLELWTCGMWRSAAERRRGPLLRQTGDGDSALPIAPAAAAQQLDALVARSSGAGRARVVAALARVGGPQAARRALEAVVHSPSLRPRATQLLHPLDCGTSVARASLRAWRDAADAATRPPELAAYIDVLLQDGGIGAPSHLRHRRHPAGPWAPLAHTVQALDARMAPLLDAVVAATDDAAAAPPPRVATCAALARPQTPSSPVRRVRAKARRTRSAEAPPPPPPLSVAGGDGVAALLPLRAALGGSPRAQASARELLHVLTLEPPPFVPDVPAGAGEPSPSGTATAPGEPPARAADASHAALLERLCIGDPAAPQCLTDAAFRGWLEARLMQQAMSSQGRLAPLLPGDGVPPAAGAFIAALGRAGDRGDGELCAHVLARIGGPLAGGALRALRAAHRDPAVRRVAATALCQIRA